VTLSTAEGGTHRQKIAGPASHKARYTWCVPKAVSVRLDDDALRALRLLEAEGTSRSAAIRDAIIEAAERRRRSERLRAEVEAIASDPEDRREMNAVATLMEDLRDPW
jgi:metal-responsive CopG/Arc/MetJ family transcriptional regulator